MARSIESAQSITHSHQTSSVILTWADAITPDESPISRWPRKLVRIIILCLTEMKENVLTIRAGYLTYAILLSMVPMLAMSTAVVKGLGGGDQLREVVSTYIQTLERSSGQDDTQASSTETSPQTELQTKDKKQREDMVGHLSSAADKIFDYVDRTNFATLGTFGMVGILFSVIMVLGQVEKSLNVIWKVKDGRSFLRKVADYLALMILMPISLNVTLAAGTMLQSQSLGIHVDQFLPIEWIQTLLLKGLPIAVLSLTLYVAYIFFPNTKTQGIPTMIGALIAGTCWFVTQNIYIDMQIGVAKYNAIYGSFATIPLFLAWVWVGWLFVLIGAEIAYAIQNEPHHRFVSKTPRPVLQISAALDICSLIGRRFSGAQPTSTADITEQCPEYQPDLLKNVLDALVDNGILHYTKESDEIMPSRPPELLTNRKIIETVLGKDIPDTPGGHMTLQAITKIVDVVPEDRVSESGKLSEPGESAAVGSCATTGAGESAQTKQDT